MISLPIDSHLNSIFQQIQNHSLVLLQAEPGSGKSTRVPPYIAQQDPEALVFLVQPRRVAAQMVAQRIAEESQQPLGGNFVGYQIRFDKRLHDKTQIQVVTDGLLIQRLARSTYEGQKIYLILDEFHERGVYSDLLFSWALNQIQQGLNPHLRLVLMSATVDEKKWIESLPELTDLLKVVKVPGQVYPLRVEYESLSLPLFSKKDRSQRVLDLLAQNKDQPGNTLVFLPSASQIEELAERISGLFPQWPVYKLYSKLRPEEQMRALNQKDKKAITLATNIAETSLTLPGVNCVIDSGLENQSEYSREKDTYQLRLQRISVDSADQRAGRAARLGEGVCYRLWTPADQARLKASITPEVLRLSPEDFVFQSLQLSLNPLKSSLWLDTPQEMGLAIESLESLGILQAKPQLQLTQVGLSYAGLSISHRLAHFLNLCQHNLKKEDFTRACWAVAFLSEGDFLLKPEELTSHHMGDCDLQVRVDLLMEPSLMKGFKISSSQIQKIKKVKQQIEEFSFTKEPLQKVTSWIQALALAFDSHLAWRRGEKKSKALKINGRGLQLSKTSLCKKSEYFIVLDSFEVLGERPKPDTEVHLAAKIDKKDLLELFLDQIILDSQIMETEKGEIFLETQKKLKALPLGSPQRETLPEEKRARVYAESALNKWSDFVKEQPDVESFFLRLQLWHQLFPQEGPKILAQGSETLMILEMIFQEHTTFKEAMKQDLMKHFKMLLSEAQWERLNQLFPLVLTLPNRRVKIEYTNEGEALVST